MSLNVNIPRTQQPRVVIVGGGFAGLNLINALKNTDFQVVLIDRHNYHTFQPLLYQVATGGLEPSSIAHPLRKFIDGNKNVIFRLADVQHIDTQNNWVETTIGNISFDYLVVATGTKTNFFGNEILSKNCMQLKTIPQALDLRTLILENLEKALLTTNDQERTALMTFVVVGGGPTGVELAGALGELKNHVLPKDYPELDITQMKIYLVESSAEVLDIMTDQASAKALQFLEELTITPLLNTKVTDYDNQIVTLSNHEKIPAKTVIWTAGVTADMPNGIPPDQLARGRRIIVNQYNQINGKTNIFAVGDVCYQTEEKYPNGYPQIAPVAISQAKLVAKNIIKIHKNQPDLQPFIYHDKGSMATVGRNRAVVDMQKFKFQGLLAWFAWMFVHLITLIGFRNKLIVLTNWIWNYISYDRHLRLIIRNKNYYTEK
jgi:NADH dehydrogenase